MGDSAHSLHIETKGRLNPVSVYLVSRSMMNFDTLYQSISLLPLAVIGIFIGYRLLKIIEENLFYNILYALILVSSTKLIIDFV